VPHADIATCSILRKSNGSVIGNTTLRFDDAQPGTTRVLVADVGRGPEPVPYPYEVQAAFWKDGPHAIRLTATSTGGTVWTGALNVTLDRTPPPLTDATVRQEAGGKLLLSVRATGAASVVASISTPSGPIRVPMSRSGSGEFVATALAPEKWTDVTFVSTGLNGVESSVTVSASSRTPIPMPAWAALAGIALAAWAAGGRSRRRG
jgi:hypothetical protein